jgi:hypothetical protein
MQSLEMDLARKADARSGAAGHSREAAQGESPARKRRDSWPEQPESREGRHLSHRVSLDNGSSREAAE